MCILDWTNFYLAFSFITEFEFTLNLSRFVERQAKRKLLRSIVIWFEWWMFTLKIVRIQLLKRFHRQTRSEIFDKEKGCEVTRFIEVVRKEAWNRAKPNQLVELNTIISVWQLFCDVCNASLDWAEKDTHRFAFTEKERITVQVILGCA